MEDFSDAKIVFDIETKKTFDEVGGAEKRDQLGVSYVGVYSYSQDKLFGFLEDELPILEKILITERPLLIGFNSLHFDLPVLQPYFRKLSLSTLPHLDILAEIEKTLGHRLKLETVAQGTLYEGKSGSGLDAIRWFREGDFASLSKYCLNDVRVTRDVYEYGLKHGKLYYTSGGEKLPIQISWGVSPSITDRVEEAFKKHEQLEIVYFEVDDEGNKEVVTRVVEVLSVNGNRFEAFCHRLNDKVKLSIPNIWHIKETGQKFAHQGALF